MRYKLEITESPDGWMSVWGLPQDRDARLSVVLRLIDSLAVIRHQDAGPGGEGQAWVEHAKHSYVSMLKGGG
jgi:hypothetical protein